MQHSSSIETFAGARASSAPAARHERLLAVAIDLMVGLLFAAPAWFLSGALADLLHQRVPAQATLLMLFAGSIAWFLIAHGVLLLRHGQTVGKRLLNIRVCDAETLDVPRGSQLFLRFSFMLIVPQLRMAGAALSLVDLMLIFRNDRRCLHDLMSGTSVVRCEPRGDDDDRDSYDPKQARSDHTAAHLW